MSANKFNGFSGKKIFFCNKGILVWKNRQRREPGEVEYITQEKGAFISVAPWKGQLCFPPHVPWNLTCSGRASGVFSEVVGGRRIKERQISPEQHFFFPLKRLTSKHLIVSLPSEGKIYYRSWARSLGGKSLFSFTDFSRRRGELLEPRQHLSQQHYLWSWFAFK